MTYQQCLDWLFSQLPMYQRTGSIAYKADIGNIVQATSIYIALKVNPYFIKDYQMAARNYSKRKSMDIIGLCRTYDMKSKGVDNHSINDGELLKEFLFKILH